LREKGGVLFLLLKHVTEKGNEFWKPPKGLVDAGEKLEETAVREVKEETGLDVRLVPGFRDVLHFFYKKEGETVSKEVIYFLGEAKSKDVRLSYEHKDFAWLSPEDAIKKAKYGTDKESLRKAADFLKQKTLAGY
jgi:8-oxo-dGTP pyrophosphatase MutT (NUDIX family)